jgi:hypothetical protein
MFIAASFQRLSPAELKIKTADYTPIVRTGDVLIGNSCISQWNSSTIGLFVKQ